MRTLNEDEVCCVAVELNSSAPLHQMRSALILHWRSSLEGHTNTQTHTCTHEAWTVCRPMLVPRTYGGHTAKWDNGSPGNGTSHTDPTHISRF